MRIEGIWNPSKKGIVSLKEPITKGMNKISQKRIFLYEDEMNFMNQMYSSQDLAGETRLMPIKTYQLESLFSRAFIPCLNSMLIVYQLRNS